MGRPKGDEGSVISRGKTMAAIYGEDRVNYFTNDYQYNPAVSGLLGGGYVVTWVSRGRMALSTEFTLRSSMSQAARSARSSG